ncbi:hypothetical protein PFFCH_02349 [Plasmodium falciparum FCH/4]|nr:hypothetical protein PFFCH_02349 [Plasmodium falciparum FCH/4]
MNNEIEIYIKNKIIGMLNIHDHVLEECLKDTKNKNNFIYFLSSSPINTTLFFVLHKYTHEECEIDKELNINPNDDTKNILTKDEQTQNKKDKHNQDDVEDVDSDNKKEEEQNIKNDLLEDNDVTYTNHINKSNNVAKENIKQEDESNTLDIHTNNNDKEELKNKKKEMKYILKMSINNACIDEYIEEENEIYDNNNNHVGKKKKK